MPFGILEDHTLEHVPGTVLLETLNHVVNTTDTTGPHELKRGTGRHSHIVLVPQPSEDLDDPLNWPLWQRDVIFIIYCYCTILVVGSIGPLLSSSAFILLIEFHVGFTEISLLTGYNLIAVGAMGVFMSAACRKYGKRPGFLFSMICAFGGTIWGGTATSYNSLVGARVLQGLGISALESVMYAVVGDLYFVHERGIRTALFTTCLSGLAQLPAMLAGVITQDLGWKWMFWLLSIFIGVAVILVALLGWETAYVRDIVYETDQVSYEVCRRIHCKRSKLTCLAASRCCRD
jgi:MFS family permease